MYNVILCGLTTGSVAVYYGCAYSIIEYYSVLKLYAILVQCTHFSVPLWYYIYVTLFLYFP